MKTLSIYFVLFVAAIFTLSSCGNNCLECEDAIKHMCDKIKANGCDPGLMENAMSRMQEDCDLFSAQVYAGYMAEQCDLLDNPFCPTCKDDNDDGPQTSTLSITEITMIFSSDAFPIPNEEFEIAATNSGNGLQTIFPFTSGYETFESFPLLTYEGDEINFQLIRLSDDLVVANNTINFTFARPGKYKTFRNVIFNYIDGEFSIEFSNW